MTTPTLAEAARALIERWDAPLWKDVPATGEYINHLRAALAAHDAAQGEIVCWQKYATAPPKAQDFARCTKKLQAKGVAYPRTCAECGLGPCRA